MKNILKSIAKISVAVLFVSMALSVSRMADTQSYFSNVAQLDDSGVTAGHWIPEIQVKAFPEQPDGNGHWYKNQPCLKIYSNIGKSTIYYSFYTGHNPDNAQKYDEGDCVKIPEGEWHFMAQAENDAKPDRWRSAEYHQDFKVDISAPEVKIENLEKHQEVSGKVKISATIKDSNPRQYWLEITDHDGKKIAGTGKIVEKESFSKDKIFIWDTRELSNGEYSIKLIANDNFGHENFDDVDRNDSMGCVKVQVKNPTPVFEQKENTEGAPVEEIQGENYTDAGSESAQITLPRTGNNSRMFYRNKLQT